MLTISEKYSYDDVLLEPAYSDVLPGNADIRARLAGDIYLNIPLISAAMDTVTEKEMAIALALQGGAGVIHRNLSPLEQAKQIGSVKRFLNWVIETPITVEKGQTVAYVRELMNHNGISGLPVVDNGVLCGIITGRDLRFCTDMSLKVEQLMTENPVVEKGKADPASARLKFNMHRIEKLPVTDEEDHLTGLITVKDIEKHENFPQAALDKQGSLIVGAAVSPMDYEKRLPLLIDNKCDFVVLDTAHGLSKAVLNAVEGIKKKYGITVIGGNVVNASGTKALIEAGSDAVKIGVGPGSICTTRIVAGVGTPQFSAVYESAEEADKYNIPIIADGGIKFSGDITKAIGAGASTVMIGNLLAGLKEAPGKEVLYEGRIFKQYRGMGSVGAIKDGSGDRYQMKENEKPVPEGVEGRVPYKGELGPYLQQLTTGLKKGMGYCGCKDIDALRNYKKFVKITGAGLRESHAHDVAISQDAPNYSV